MFVSSYFTKPLQNIQNEFTINILKNFLTENLNIAKLMSIVIYILLMVFFVYFKREEFKLDF